MEDAAIRGMKKRKEMCITVIERRPEDAISNAWLRIPTALVPEREFHASV